MVILVDIGAAGGIPKRYKKLKNLQVIGFEPHLDEFKFLKNKRNRIYINKALYKKKCLLPFYVYEKSHVSSIYEINFKVCPRKQKYKLKEIIEVETDTLDNQLKQLECGKVDILKLDTQGSELDILKGSIDTLKDVKEINIEVEFVEIYKNQPLFNDIDIFLKKHNFRLKEFTKLKKWDDMLIWGVAIYVKT